MKKLTRPLLLLVLLLLLSTGTVFADAAIGPAFAVVFGALILVIALIGIAIVLLIKAVRRRREK